MKFHSLGTSPQSCLVSVKLRTTLSLPVALTVAVPSQPGDTLPQPSHPPSPEAPPPHREPQKPAPTSPFLTRQPLCQTLPKTPSSFLGPHSERKKSKSAPFNSHDRLLLGTTGPEKAPPASLPAAAGSTPYGSQGALRASLLNHPQLHKEHQFAAWFWCWSCSHNPRRHVLNHLTCFSSSSASVSLISMGLLLPSTHEG